MKNLVICTFLIAVSTVFFGCNKNKEPSIKFTYKGEVKKSGLTVDAKEGDEVKISVEYDAPNHLKEIRFRIGNDDEEVITSNFNKKTSHSITRTITFEKSGNTQIKTSILDDKKEKADFELKVNISK